MVIWGKDAVVTGEVTAWAWYECSESGDKVLRTEQDVCGAVPERVLELVDHLAGSIGRKPFETERRPGF